MLRWLRSAKQHLSTCGPGLYQRDPLSTSPQVPNVHWCDGTLVRLERVGDVCAKAGTLLVVGL